MHELVLRQQLDLGQKNERLRQQLYTLAKYLLNDLDFDVCQPQTKAEICPYRLPPYDDKDDRVCVRCIIRVLWDSTATDGDPNES